MFPPDSKIIIVDDSNFTRTMLTRALKDLGYRKVAEAESVKAAQQYLESQDAAAPVHLIITDLNMPELSGLDLLKWLRAHGAFNSIPVIMLTTAQEKDNIIEAGKLGVSQYMIKPFSAAQLKERLEKTWKNLKPASS